MKINIGLQLYTIRDQMNLGYDEVFKRITEIGYRGVETGFRPDSGEELSKLLKKYSLKALSAGMGPNNIENNYDKVKEFMKQVDTSIIVVGFGESDLDTVEKVVTLARRLDELAKKVEKDGYVIACHNHWWEFTKRFDGKTITDVLCENSELLKFEMDIGWVTVADADPVKYINELGSRVALLHVKDFTADKKHTEAGTGVVNMKGALSAASKVGVEWGIVEQDENFRVSSFDSIKTSYDYLKTIL